MDPSLADLRSRFVGGATLPFHARREALLKLKRSLRAHEERLLEAMRTDMRKPRTEAFISDIGLVHDAIDHALVELKQWMRPQHVPTPLALQVANSVVLQRPKGVVLIIAPWNYPVLLVLSPLVAALAAGNCAVVKPSEDAPATAEVIASLIRSALDPSLVHVAQGPGSTVVPALMGSFRFDHVFFTGSAPVGKRILELAAPQLVPVTLELGGKSPAIIDATADVERAAQRVAWSKCFNAGQTCIATDHVLVHAAVKDRFLQALRKRLTEFYGSDMQRSPHLARMIHARRFETVRAYLEQGELWHGGQHDAEDRFIAPTVLLSTPLDAPVMREEIFGPVLPVLSWSDRGELRELINRNPQPLAAYLFSSDRGMQRWFSQELDFGGGCINHCLLHFGSPHLPFGGVGRSGMGRYHGHVGFDLFSNSKGLVHASTLIEPGLQYPPYSSFKERVLRWVLR